MVVVVGFDESVLKRVSCKGCGVVLLYGTSDEHQRKTSYMDEVLTETFIQCPECEEYLVVRST